MSVVCEVNTNDDDFSEEPDFKIACASCKIKQSLEEVRKRNA